MPEDPCGLNSASSHLPTSMDLPLHAVHKANCHMTPTAQAIYSQTLGLHHPNDFMLLPLGAPGNNGRWPVAQQPDRV